MPYAVIDLADKNRVVMVVNQNWQPLMIEEEWLDEDDEKPQPPTGYPENFQEVFLSKEESLKITAALEVGQLVHIDRLGYVDIGEGEAREGFFLQEFTKERVFLGKILDHLILEDQRRECLRLRRKLTEV